MEGFAYGLVKAGAKRGDLAAVAAALARTTLQEDRDESPDHTADGTTDTNDGPHVLLRVSLHLAYNVGTQQKNLGMHHANNGITGHTHHRAAAAAEATRPYCGNAHAAESLSANRSAARQRHFQSSREWRAKPRVPLEPHTAANVPEFDPVSMLTGMASGSLASTLAESVISVSDLPRSSNIAWDGESLCMRRLRIAWRHALPLRKVKNATPTEIVDKTEDDTLTASTTITIEMINHFTVLVKNAPDCNDSWFRSEGARRSRLGWTFSDCTAGDVADCLRRRGLPARLLEP